MLVATRYVLPGILALVGLAFFAVPHDASVEAAFGFLGAAASVFLYSFFYRLSMSDERERDREEAARDHYDRHGRWPDEEPGAGDPR